MKNCETRAYVDFGDGPVRVRCTQLLEHTQCKCEVLIIEGTQEKAQDAFEHARKNVFSGNAICGTHSVETENACMRCTSIKKRVDL